MKSMLPDLKEELEERAIYEKCKLRGLASILANEK
jgi:hypothetical protein